MKKLMVFSIFIGMSGAMVGMGCGDKAATLPKPGSNSNIEATLEEHRKALAAHAADLANIGPKIDGFGNQLREANIVEVKRKLEANATEITNLQNRAKSIEEALQKSDATKFTEKISKQDDALQDHGKKLEGQAQEIAALRNNLRRLYCGSWFIATAVFALTCEEVREAAGNLSSFFKR